MLEYNFEIFRIENFVMRISLVTPHGILNSNLNVYEICYLYAYIYVHMYVSMFLFIY